MIQFFDGSIFRFFDGSINLIIQQCSNRIIESSNHRIIESSNLQNKSQTTIPTLTDIFRECLVPSCGISILPSQIFMAS